MFILLWKIIKIDLRGDLNGQILTIWQLLPTTPIIRSCLLQFLATFLFINKTYVFDGRIVRAPAFFRFFIKKEKHGPSRNKKAGKLVLFIFLIFLL